MASVGPVFASSAVDGGSDWSSPSNILALDGSNTTVTLVSPPESSSTLSITDFSGVSAIPANAVVDGIEVEFYYAGTTTLDSNVDLIGVAGSSTKFTLGGGVAGAGWYSLGGSADTWGTSISGDQVNDSAFGVSILMETAGVNGSVFLDAVRVTITYSVPPDQVTGLTATPVTQSQIDLSWTEPTDNGASITGYKIERESPVGAGWSDLVADTSSTATTYSDDELGSGTEYNYRVSAINSIGTGDASAAANATTWAQAKYPQTGIAERVFPGKTFGLSPLQRDLYVHTMLARFRGGSVVTPWHLFFGSTN